MPEGSFPTAPFSFPCSSHSSPFSSPFHPSPSPLGMKSLPPSYSFLPPSIKETPPLSSSSSSTFNFTFSHDLVMAGLSGYIAGYGAEIATYPLEAFNHKVLLHQNQIDPEALRQGRYLSLPRQTFLDKHLFKKDIKTMTLTTAPISGLLMCSYELFRRKMNDLGLLPQGRPFQVGLVCGTLAQGLEAFVMQPVFVTRSKMHQLILDQGGGGGGGGGGGDHLPQQHKTIRFSPTLKGILQSEGPRGLYRGYLSTVASGAPFLAAYFGLGEELLQRLSRHLGIPPSEVPMGYLGGVGFSAAVSAVIITTPLEIFRQIVATELKSFGHSREVWRKEGLRMALRGSLGRMREDLRSKALRVAPKSAFKKATFGFVKRALKKTLVTSIKRAKI